MKQTINVSNKAEVVAAVTSDFDGGYNYFEGDIRKGNLRANVVNCFYGNIVENPDYLLGGWQERGC